MKHAQRIKIIRELSRRVVRKYSKDILFIGVYGSVKRNQDKDYSDIELFAIKKSNKKYPYIATIHHGIPIYLEFLSKDDVLNQIKNVDTNWPINVGKYLDPLQIYSRENIRKEFRDIYNSLTKSDFEDALQFQFIELVECMNRIRNNYKYGDLTTLKEAADWFGGAVNILLALLNRRYYIKNGLARMSETQKFRIKPQNYESLMYILYSGTTKQKIYSAAKQLDGECIILLKKNQVAFTEPRKISDIEI